MKGIAMNNFLLHGADLPGETLGKHLHDARNQKAPSPHRVHEGFEEHLDAVERWLKNGAVIGRIEADAFHEDIDLEFEYQREGAEEWGDQTLCQTLKKIEVIHEHARMRAQGNVPSKKQLWELEQSLYGPDEDHYDGDEVMVNYLDMYLE